MLRLAFVAIIVLVGLAAGLRSRFGALLAYVWFALFRPQDWLWTDITPYRMSLVFGLLLVGPALLTGVLPVIAHPLGIGALVFLGAAGVAQHGAVDQVAGWYWLDFLAKLVLVSLFAVRLTSTRARFLTLVAVMAFSFGFHPIKAGVVSIVFGGVRYFNGVGGAFIDNNTYALGTVMIVPLLLATAQNATRRWLRWIAAASVPLSMFTVVSTFSRGGLVALGAAILTWTVLQRRRVVLLTAAAVLFPLFVLVMPVPSGYSERIATIGTYEEVEDASALSRLHYWRVALRMAADHPLGVGLWNFEANYDRYDTLDGQYGMRRAAHNSHLQALTEAGWIGAAAWASLFVVAFRLLFRARAASARLGDNERFVFTSANALIASMAGFVVGGMFLSMALNDVTWLTFAVVASLDRLVASWSAATVGETGEAPAPALAIAAAPSVPVALGP